MGKKKQIHHDSHDPYHQSHHHAQEPADKAEATAMDDSSEKLENLKFLNSKLLKEASDRRHEVESLQRSKGSLELALNRFEMENREFQSELDRLRDTETRLELERLLVSVFVEEQIGQRAKEVGEEREEFWREKVDIEGKLRSLEFKMRDVLREKSEIERVLSGKDSECGLLKKKLSEIVAENDNLRDKSGILPLERDELRDKLEVQMEETNRLRIKLAEAENREREIQEEVQRLEKEQNAVLEEKEDRERRIESLMRDKDAIESSLAESTRLIEELKRGIEEKVREKKEIEEQRSSEVMKKNELKTTVASLNAMVLGLQNEEQRLKEKLADLDKREKEEKRRSYESLIGEKGLVERDLNQALMELDEQKKKLAEMVREKTEIEEEKMRTEVEISRMQREIGELRETISATEASCRYQEEENELLHLKVNQCRNEITRIVNERDEARNGFDEEKRICASLREKILKLEKKIEEAQEKISEMKVENNSVIEEKKELEKRYDGLMKEMASLENTLSKGRKELDYMQKKVEAADANLECVLNTIKSTSGIVCPSKDEMLVAENDGLVGEEQVGEEVRPFVAELEAIKKAFKTRESKVEDMKRELEFLQNSVAEAHKKKNFWTLVSSATTIFAAASVAYVARAR
ncbi:hypothetical protein NMG60_11020669 [Bertholletia excelsa]